MFQHFLLTRMNTLTPFGEQGACLDEDWLQHRFGLFERYTLPSIQAQVRGHPFEWLLFTHENTPQGFRERLKRYSLDCPEIRLVPCTEFDEEVPRREVAARLRDGITHVITSRVDNDDALGRTFISSVQREYRGQDGEFINFDLGYQLEDGRVYRAEHAANPYCSAIEARTNFKGVFAVSHVDIRSLYPVKQVRDRRRWLTVIHGRNALNRVEGQRCQSDELTGEFPWLRGIDFKDGWMPLLADRAGRHIRRLARSAAGAARR